MIKVEIVSQLMHELARLPVPAKVDRRSEGAAWVRRSHCDHEGVARELGRPTHPLPADESFEPEDAIVPGLFALRFEVLGLQVKDVGAGSMAHRAPKGAHHKRGCWNRRVLWIDDEGDPMLSVSLDDKVDGRWIRSVAHNGIPGKQATFRRYHVVVVEEDHRWIVRSGNHRREGGVWLGRCRLVPTATREYRSHHQRCCASR